MIIGGVGAVSKIGEHGAGIGRKTFYLPAVVYGSADVSAIPAIEISASVRIKNTDNQWVYIDDTEYIQMSANDGGQATANLTIRNLQRWSNVGDENAGLLSPSSRLIEINCTVNGMGFLIFSGRVTGYSEAIGRRSEAITLVCRSMLQGQLEEGDVTVSLPKLTRYKILDNEIKRFGVYGPIWLFVPDSVEPVNFNFSRVSELVRGIFGWVTRTTILSSGIMIEERGTTDGAEVLELSDLVIAQETRSVQEGRYNTLRTAAMSGETWIYDEVSDAADVASQGKIYGPRRVTSETDTIEEVNEVALNMIYEQLRGVISATTRFNPLVQLRMRTSFSGEKMRLNGIGVISRVQHRLRRGDASTDITLRLIEVL